MQDHKKIISSSKRATRYTLQAVFLLDLFSEPDDRDDIFLRNFSGRPTFSSRLSVCAAIQVLFVVDGSSLHGLLLVATY
jgi:hypothetical protein